MSKHDLSNQEVAIDKVESYINRNFKRIVGVLISVILIGLGIYGIKQYSDNTKIADMNKLGEYEYKLNSGMVTEEILEKYIKTCENISGMKDYCYYRGGVILAGIGSPKGKEYLKKVSGDYKEFADSILYDLGEKVDIAQYKENGKLGTIWKYRLVLQDKKQLGFLDNSTLNTRLIASIVNWE
ncbi:MAG: hypothetical protein LDL13_05985 [Calditerrivibrio sp.]|nr:hypothetical protein [Calditerrivibrio sp.]